MATYYEPSDGDYNEDDFGKFFDDIQAEGDFDIGYFPEICTSLEEDNTIFVLALFLARMMNVTNGYGNSHFQFRRVGILSV